MCVICAKKRKLFKKDFFYGFRVFHHRLIPQTYPWGPLPKKKIYHNFDGAKAVRRTSPSSLSQNIRLFLSTFMGIRFGKFVDSLTKQTISELVTHGFHCKSHNSNTLNIPIWPRILIHCCVTLSLGSIFPLPYAGLSRVTIFVVRGRMTG